LLLVFPNDGRRITNDEIDTKQGCQVGQVTLYEGERLDRLGYQGLRIIQNPAKFKFTIDAFLLAALVENRTALRLLDLGTGGGVLPLLLAGQNTLLEVCGVEIQPQLAEMARRSVLVNNLADRVDIIEGDLKKLPGELGFNSFDYVIANPPFYPVGEGVISSNDALAGAKFEINCTLADVIKAASRMVKGHGKVALVLPAQRLSELLADLSQCHLTPKLLCLVHPKATAAANLVLVQARPGAKPGLQVLPPIFVYGADAQYTERMRQIFNGAKLI
jgi:tRNA1Val (adenine37-N6)-methyltransferase